MLWVSELRCGVVNVLFVSRVELSDGAHLLPLMIIDAACCE